MHIKAPAAATIVMGVDQFNSREALPCLRATYSSPLSVISTGNDQQRIMPSNMRLPLWYLEAGDLQKKEKGKKSKI